MREYGCHIQEDMRISENIQKYTRIFGNIRKYYDQIKSDIPNVSYYKLLNVTNVKILTDKS